MELIESQRRLYPENGILAHAIGYTGEISESELDNPDYAKYNQGQIIGKTGIEKQYNDTLMGVDGERQSVVDNLGREREVLGIKEATPGKNLQLTIDLDLQVVAELALGDRRGSVVALDPNTGEILAMASHPTFDPNKFAVRIKSADWKELTKDPGNPLLNRAIQAQWAPGSTFKPIVAMAGLESGSIDEDTTFQCPGGATFLRPFLPCWGHHGAFRCTRESCNRAMRTSITSGIRRESTTWRFMRIRPGSGPERDRSAERSRRNRAFAGVEAAHLSAEMVCGRDGFGFDRAGRDGADAAATGAGDRRDGDGRRLARASSGEVADEDRRSRMSGRWIRTTCIGWFTECMGW